MIDCEKLHKSQFNDHSHEILELFNLIQNNYDIRYINYQNILSSNESMFLWNAALDYNNWCAIHFIITSSKNGILRQCILSAFKHPTNISVDAASCAVAAYSRIYDDLFYLFSEMYQFSPAKTLRIIKKCEEGPLEIFKMEMERGRFSKCGPFWTYICANASKRWSTILSAVFVRMLWKQFLERRLHPDSSYIRMKGEKFLANAI